MKPITPPSGDRPQPTPGHPNDGSHALFEASPIGMLFCSGLTVAYANAAMAQMLGCTPGDRVDDFFVHAADREALCHAIEHQGDLRDRCVFARSRSGALLSCQVTLMPWRWEGADGVMVWASDVTERQREQTRLANLARVAHDWFWETDENHRFTYVSTSTALTDRLLEQRLIGKTRWELPGPPQDALWARHRAVLDARQPFQDFEYEVHTVDGESHWISISGRPVWAPDGRFLGYQGVSLDVTEKRLIEAHVHETLKETRAASERLLDFVHLAVDRFWETDDQHRFVEIWGRGGVSEEVRQHWQGRRAWEIIQPETEAEQRIVDECRRRVSAHLPLENFEYQVTTSEGKRQWLSISAKPVFDGDGRFLGYRGCNTVITGRKQREEELRQALEQAEAARTTESALLATIHRDISTPMTEIVDGMTALLLQGDLPDGQRERLAVLQDALQHLLARTGHLLEPSELRAT